LADLHRLLHLLFLGTKYLSAQIFNF